VLSNAIASSEAANGPMSDWSLYKFTFEDQGADQLEWTKQGLEYIFPYLDGAVMKYNTYPEILAYGDSNKVRSLSGNPNNGIVSRYFIITKDGMFISIAHVNWENILIYFVLDINGKKGPNQWGKDIFAFQVSNRNKLTGYNFGNFTYEQISNDYCNKAKKRDANKECSTLIMQDGWKIKYQW